MSSSRKKVIVRKHSRDWLAGYLPISGFSKSGQMEILDLAGKVITMNLEEVKWVCFVRDFNSGEPSNPERLVRKTFAGRPRGEGILLRLVLKDNETLEGIATNDVSLLENDGIFLTPPDTRSNTQRVFLPRTSISELEVVAVIAAPSKRKTAVVDAQESLFSPQG
jgi:hypothetical protein